MGKTLSTDHTPPTRRSGSGSIPLPRQHHLRRETTVGAMEVAKVKVEHDPMTGSKADIFFVSVIFLQAVNLGIEVELSCNSPTNQPTGWAKTVLTILEVIFTAIFCFELVYHLRHVGCEYLKHITHILDAFLVFVAVMDLGFTLTGTSSPFNLVAAMRIFRLLRLARVLRLLRFFRELKVILKMLMRTFSAACWSVLLLITLCYCGALLCAEILGVKDDDPDIQFLFGSVPHSLLTHVKLAMVEAWPDIAAPMFSHSGLWRYYVAIFICIANFALLNVVTGAICEQVIDVSSNLPPRDSDEVERDLEAFRKELHEVYEDTQTKDTDESYTTLFNRREMITCLANHEISAPFDVKHLHLLLRLDHQREMSFDDIVFAVMRMRGSQRDRLSQSLQFDVLRTHRQSIKGCHTTEREVQNTMRTSVLEVGNRLRNEAGGAARTLTELHEALHRDGRHRAMMQKSWEGTLPEARESSIPAPLQDPQHISGAIANLEAASRKLQETLKRADEAQLQRRTCSPVPVEKPLGPPPTTTRALSPPPFDSPRTLRRLPRTHANLAIRMPRIHCDPGSPPKVTLRDRVWQWESLQPGGTAPRARGGHTATLVSPDSGRGSSKIFLFGGLYDTEHNDTHVLEVDEKLWTQPHCRGAAPEPRYSHSATLVGTRIMYFGGRSKAKYLGDLHALDTTTLTWCRGPGSGGAPPARHGHTATLHGSKLYVFGGVCGEKYYGDLHCLDLSSMTWSSPQQQGPPPRPRFGHTALLIGETLAIHGGFCMDSTDLGSKDNKAHPPKTCYLNDTRVLDLGRMLWTRLRTHGEPPTGRFGHTLSMSHGDAVMFGGWAGTLKPQAETETEGQDTCDHCMTLRTADMQWVSNRFVGVPAPSRYGHTATAVGPHLIIIGGWDGTKPLNDVIVLRDCSVVDNAGEDTRLGGQANVGLATAESISHDLDLKGTGGVEEKSNKRGPSPDAAMHHT